jgi:hypothetical protein
MAAMAKSIVIRTAARELRKLPTRKSFVPMFFSILMYTVIDKNIAFRKK